MLFRLFSSLCVAAMLFISPANAAEIVLHGSTTVFANLVGPHEAEIESKSGQQINIVANGSSRGIKGVISGDAQIGMISAPLESVVAKINKKNPGSVDGSVLKDIQVGEARVAFTTHTSNAVKELTLAQITDILKGTVKNWNEVGGADAPIMVITEDSNGGLRAMVEGELLSKESMTPANVRELPNGTQIPKVVAQLPNTLGVMSAALVNDSLVEIKTDSPIAQPLIFVIKGDASAEVQAVIDASKELGGM